MFDKKKIDEFEIGTFTGLSKIHEFLFSDIYDFAGKIRKENISKGTFRFASVIYLKEILFKIDKEEYLLAMERSPVKDTEIKLLLESALTDKINLYKRYRCKLSI